MNDDQKIILIYRTTRLEELIRRYNTQEQAKFYIEHLGEDFSLYQNEHQNYKKVIRESTDYLSAFGYVLALERQFLPNFMFSATDLIVVIGQDGLVANTLKYLSGQKVIGVNPDRKHYDGILLPFESPELPSVLKNLNKRNIKEVSMAKAELNDGQVLYGVNDLFIGQRTHISSRYGIQLGALSENQSSSGIIISTGLGSTGWLKSILTGADQIMQYVLNADSADKRKRNSVTAPLHTMRWDSNELFYTVREPFPSQVTGTELVFGKFGNNTPLKITSYMPEGGVIFSDGIESDFLSFNSGFTATISVAKEKGLLVT